MNPIAGTVAAIACIAQIDTVAPVTAGDPGLVMGAALPGDDIAARLAALERAGEADKPFALIALARALFAQGVPASIGLLPVESGGLADSDRSVMLMATPGRSLDNATDILTRAVKARQGAGAPAATLAVAEFNLGYAYALVGEYVEAEPLQRRALATLATAWGAGDARLTAVQLGLAATLAGLGRTAEAELMIREVLNELTATGRGESRLAAEALTSLAGIEARRGAHGQAEANLRRAIAIGDATRAAAIRPVAVTAEAFAASLRRAGIEPQAAIVDGLTRAATVQAFQADAVQSRRFAALAITLLALERGDEAREAAAMALKLGPRELEARFAVALARVDRGDISPDDLIAIEQGLDEGAYSGGRMRLDLIAARTRAARLLIGRAPERAWVQVDQASDAVTQLVTSPGMTAEDAIRTGNALVDTRRAMVQVAWAASRRPAQAWPKSQRRFTAWFDIDRRSMSHSTVTALDAAIATWKRVGGSIWIAGHTDRIGSAAYNVRLSERWAMQISGYLQANGIPSSVIYTVAYGEAKPAIPTEDDVADRRNRRVVVTVVPPGDPEPTA